MVVFGPRKNDQAVYLFFNYPSKREKISWAYFESRKAVFLSVSKLRKIYKMLMLGLAILSLTLFYEMLKYWNVLRGPF